MNADKKISRVTDTEKQQTETYRYWRSLPVGDRLSAVWDVSEAAYSFAAAFKGNLTDDAQRSQRTIRRVQPTRSSNFFLFFASQLNSATAHAAHAHPFANQPQLAGSAGAHVLGQHGSEEHQQEVQAGHR